MDGASRVHTPTAEPCSHAANPVTADSHAATAERRAARAPRYLGVYSPRPPRGPIGVPSGFANVAPVMPCEPAARDGWPTTLTGAPIGSPSFVQAMDGTPPISICHSIF